MNKRIIVDTETTSIRPDYQTGAGVIWELALIELGDNGKHTEHLWWMRPDPSIADPAALAVGHFYERTSLLGNVFMPINQMMDMGQDRGALDLANMPEDWVPAWSQPEMVARVVAPMLANATVIAAVPSFDCTKFLAAFLAHHGESPEPWHYRLRDIGSIAYGFLHGFGHGAVREIAERGISTKARVAPDCQPIDAGTDDFARALGIDPAKYDRHTALGDCRLVLDMLNAMEGKP